MDFGGKQTEIKSKFFVLTITNFERKPISSWFSGFFLFMVPIFEAEIPTLTNALGQKLLSHRLKVKKIQIIYVNLGIVFSSVC